MNLEKQCNELSNKSLESEYFSNKSVDLKGKSRSINLRIDGIAKKARKKSWEQCEEQLQIVVKEKLDLDNVQIERAQRVRNKWNKESKIKSRSVVFKILSYKQKKEVQKNVSKLKGTDIFINKDFFHETMQHRQQILAKIKRLRSKDQIAYLN